MSYLHFITTDMTDESLNSLVKNSMSDEWGCLNDLQQSQLLYEAFEHRQHLSDQRAINDLLAVQPRFPSIPHHHPTVATHSLLRPTDTSSASSPTMKPGQSPSLPSPVPPSALHFSPFFHRAHTMATYTQELFKHAVTQGNDLGNQMPAIPLELPYSMIEDAHHVAQVAAKAYRNPSVS